MKTNTNKGRAARGWLRWLVGFLLRLAATVAVIGMHHTYFGIGPRGGLAWIDGVVMILTAYTLMWIVDEWPKRSKPNNKVRNVGDDAAS